MRHMKRVRSGRRLLFESLESRQLLTTLTHTEMDQFIIELINRARANPEAEAARLGIGLNDGLGSPTNPNPISTAPKQPLAVNELIYTAAVGHSNDMVERNYFNHISPENKGPGHRLQQAGYPYTTWAENIAYTYDLQQFHDLLFKSPGHRANILRESVREIGVGIVLRDGRFTGTEKFATRQGDAFFTGVVFSDRVVADEFYSLGESLPGVTITAERPGAPILTTVTGPSGAYSLAAPPGTYKIRAAGPGLASPLVLNDVVIGTANVKVDFMVPIVQIGPDAWETNDTAATASVLTGQELYLTDLTIHSREDLDYFRWTSPWPGPTTFTLELERDQGDLDLVILDPLGNVLGESRSETDREVVTLAVAPEQPLTVLVLGYEQALHGNYRLRISGPPQAPAPIARPDRTFTGRATPVAIAVLANDDAPESQLQADRVRITQAPVVGEAVWNEAQRRMIYTPPAQFRGMVEFQYVVENEQGTPSPATSVRVSVLDQHSAPWQNPLEPLDVNADQMVTSIDALQVINSLNTRSARLLPLPLLSDEFPSPYLDVDGDDYATPLDVLHLINALNSGQASGARFLRPEQPQLPMLEATNETGLALDRVITQSLVTLEQGRFLPQQHQLWIANPDNGQRVIAQTHVVTLHEDGSAADVEVTFPVSMAVGEHQTLHLQRRSGSSSLRPMHPPAGLNLTAGNDLLVARLHGADGHLYEANLLAQALGSRVGQVDNRWEEVYEFQATLTPSAPETPAPPQLWQLRTWITVRRDEPVAGLRILLEPSTDIPAGGFEGSPDLLFNKLELGVKQLLLAWVQRPGVTEQPTRQVGERIWTDALPTREAPQSADDLLGTLLAFELAPPHPPAAMERAAQYAASPPRFVVVPNPQP